MYCFKFFPFARANYKRHPQLFINCALLSMYNIRLIGLLRYSMFLYYKNIRVNAFRAKNYKEQDFSKYGLTDIS